MTDASIPLGFQTPQQQSPLASLSQIMAFKNGMAETELRRQQILQSQSLQAEQQAKADQANRDLADQGKLQELMKNPDVNARIRKGDTSDIDGVLQPKSVDALRSKQLELQNGYLTQTKEQNQIASDTIKNKIQPSVNAFYDMLKPDGSLDFDRINSSMPGIIQGLNQDGAFKDAGLPAPNAAGRITSKDDLDALSASLHGLAAAREHVAGLQEQAAKTAASSGAATKDTADAAKAQAEADKQNMINGFMKAAQNGTTTGVHPIDSILGQVDPQAAASYKPAYDAAMAGGGPEAAKAILTAAAEHAATLSTATTAKKLADMKALAPTEIGIAGQKAGVEETARTNAQLAVLNQGAGPDGISQTAKDIANYRINPATALARLQPAARERILSDAQKVNPDFRQENYNAFNATEKDATTGKMATNATALDTMMGHLTVLHQASVLLQNGDVQSLNKIANAIGAQTGSDARTTYDTIVHRLGPEVTKAYVASGGSVGERGTNEEDFASSLGPKQIASNIGVSAQLADSKIKALQDQYNRGTYGRGKQKLISDEAEQARQTLTQLSPVHAGGGAAFKAGDTQVKNGYTYKRDEGGTWHLQP
jgi:hypothetical protein